MTELLCKDCDAIVLFVTPECEDGQDCGDLMCVICGAAVTIGGLLLDDRIVGPIVANMAAKIAGSSAA